MNRRILVLLVCLVWVGFSAFALAEDLLLLPGALMEIDEEAFYQTSAAQIVRIEDGTLSIASRAFARSGLKRIRIPQSVSQIAGDAFEGCNGLIIYGKAGSYAQRYAADHGFAFYPDALFGQMDDAVTARDYAAMLDALVEQINPSGMQAWSTMLTEFRASSSPLTRSDAVCALYYAMSVLGEPWFNIGNHWAMISQAVAFDDYMPNDALFADMDLDGTAVQTNLGNDGFKNREAARAFIFGLRSYKTGRLAFAYDAERNTFAFDQPLDRAAAERSVRVAAEHRGYGYQDGIQLGDTNCIVIGGNTDLSRYEVQSDARRSAILSSRTEIVRSDTLIPGQTYTGTAYYVSPSGKPFNDGLTPETAVSDPYDVNPVSGDAVFFERGGMWRLSRTLFTQEGVTYSAYGEGAKPILTFSPENGADPDKWQLYYSDDTGKKIWKYYRDMREFGSLVLDEEYMARREYEWWTRDAHLSMDFVYDEEDPDIVKHDVVFTDVKSIEDTLDENLTALGRTDYSGFDYPVQVWANPQYGPLYFRCDEGNPGALYRSIEFTGYGDATDWVCGVVAMAPHAVLDNISVRYSGWASVWTSDLKNEGVVVQNCEVAFGGGILHEMCKADPSGEYGVTGDGVYLLCNNAVIADNYVHDIKGYGITFEDVRNQQTYEEFDSLTIRGNLIENCGSGIVLADDANWTSLAFRSLVIEDNIINDMGYGELYSFNFTHNALHILDSKMGLNGIEVRNNVFSRSRETLLSVNRYAEEDILFEGNTFIQDRYKPCALAGIYVYPMPGVWETEFPGI